MTLVSLYTAIKNVSSYTMCESHDGGIVHLHKNALQNKKLSTLGKLQYSK